MFALVEIQPLDPVSGTRTVVRTASSHNLAQTGWNGQSWLPAIAAPGAIEEQYFDGDFTAPISTSQLNMSLASQILAEIMPDVLAMRWQDSSVKLWLSEDPASPALTLQGEITRFERSNGLIKIGVTPGAKAGDTDVLGLTYAGTTGAEGGTDIKGRLKPMALGVVRNAEPVLIDVPNNVYQFHAYGPLKAVTAMYERGASFGASLGDYANYAALVAAAIPEGRWGTCLASGMVRMGAPQYGVITGDIEGDYTGAVLADTTGAVIRRIAALRSVSGDSIDTDSMDALDIFSATLPGGGRIGLYLTEQTTLLDIAQQLCLPLNAQAGFSLLGKLFAMRVGLFTPTFTLDALGREMPVVAEMFEADTLPPYKTIVMGGDRSWRVHSLDEIAFNLNLIDRGDYSDTETYREGNIVRTPGGSTWVYVNPTASAGNDPAEDAYWDQLTGEIEYPDGTPISDLQPAEPAADVTATAQVIVVPPPAQTIYRTWTGVPKEGQSTRTLTPIIERGGTSIRTDDSVEVSITPSSGITATVDTTDGSADKGRITATSAVAGTIAMTVTVDGLAYGPFAIPFAVQDDQPPIDQGTAGGSDSTLASVPSTSYSQMASTDPGEALFTVTVASGQKIVGTAPIVYNITANSGSVSVSLLCKWEYRLVGDTTWLGFPGGVLTADTPASYIASNFDREAGTGNFNDEKTGLSAGNYEVRLVGAKSSSLGNAITVQSGTATVRVQS